MKVSGKIHDDANEISFAGLTFANISTDEVLGRIKAHLESNDSSMLDVITPNIFHLNLASRVPGDSEMFNRAAISVPDGWPVAAALRIFRGYRHGRVAGSDLSLDVLLLAAQESYTVGLLGGSDVALASAYSNMRSRYPALKMVHLVNNPVLPDRPTAESIELLLSTVNKTPVDILLLCLGAPKSEAHLDACRNQIKARVVLCVGATVDFMAGTAIRAPRWVQMIGLEWAFRLIQEPRRLWRRYLTSGFGFLSLLVRESKWLLFRQ